MEKKKHRQRGTGSIGKVKGSPFYYIWYRQNGRTVRESSKSESKMVAENLLQRRLGEVGLGSSPTTDFKRFRYDDARAALLADYEARGRSSLVTRATGERTICGLSQLDGYFTGRTLSTISADDVRGFIRERQADGAGNSIVNRSLALLRRMLKIAHREKKLRDLPHITLLKEPDPREGFLYPEQFAALLTALPEKLRPIVSFLYYTGSRTGAAKKIDWTQVVFDGDRVEIAVKASQIKNRKPLLLPLPGELAESLRNTKHRKGHVFDATNLIKAFRKACCTVGLGAMRDPADRDGGYDGMTLHDLRRSGVRNLRRAGVAEDVAMKISGHRTRAVFARYNIIDSDDLHDAMLKVQKFVVK